MHTMQLASQRCCGRRCVPPETRRQFSRSQQDDPPKTGQEQEPTWAAVTSMLRLRPGSPEIAWGHAQLAACPVVTMHKYSVTGSKTNPVRSGACFVGRDNLEAASSVAFHQAAVQLLP